MKKLIALVLALVMCFALCACGQSAAPAATEAPAADAAATEAPAADATAASDLKVGFIFLHDENSTYDLNFMNGAKEACANLGLSDDQVIFRTNIPEGQECYDAAAELADAGCNVIFADSFGHEDFMIQAAKEFPEVQFCHATGTKAHTEDLANYHNAFASIYEGRYLAGVVAGMKLQQLIDEGTIKPEEAVIGYVGAFSFAEVISGMTSYFLGARSVCPSVTMKVQFVGSWSDATAEADAAKALIDLGCIVISQHSDNTTPATAAQAGGVYHTGHNNDMTTIAPEASIIGTRIDWTNYFVHAIECVVNGTELEQDWCKGMSDDEVVMTPLNEAIAAPGTAEKLAEVEEGIKNGTIQVFDTSTFTVDGKTVDHAFAVDTDGDFVADSEEAVFDGAFHESYFQSAPYFTLRIDGIEWINEAY